MYDVCDFIDTYSSTSQCNDRGLYADIIENIGFKLNFEAPFQYTCSMKNEYYCWIHFLIKCKFMQDIELSNCVWKFSSQEIFEKYKCPPGAELKRIAYTCIPVQ